VCHARKPACGACLLAKDCPAFGTGPTEPEIAAKLVKGEEAEHLIDLAERTRNGYKPGAAGVELPTMPRMPAGVRGSG